MLRASTCLLLVACGAAVPEPPPQRSVALHALPPPPAAPELPVVEDAGAPPAINPALPLPDRARVLAVTGQKLLLQMSAERTYFAVLDAESLCVEESLQTIPAQRFGLTPVPLELHFELKMEDDVPAATGSDGRVLFATRKSNDTKECAMAHDPASKKTVTLACARGASWTDAGSFAVSPRGGYVALVERTAIDNVLSVYRVADKKVMLRQHEGNQFVDPSSFFDVVLDDASHAAWNDDNDFGTFPCGMLGSKRACDRDNGSAVGFLPDGSVLVLVASETGLRPVDTPPDTSLAGNACKAFRRAVLEPLVAAPVPGGSSSGRRK